MEKPTFSGTFYQIILPSFCDGNGDGIGDLPGLIRRLDYLQDLGIEGIWLSPIHPSETFHKYDVLDYYAVSPDLGTMEDLEALIDQCHKRGIRVLLDLVFNCCSWHHPAFQKALRDPGCPERRWFWFDDTPEAAAFDRNSVWNGLPSWRETEDGQKYIGIYSPVMPDFNFHDAGLRQECKRIARFWLEKGVDGFRLDSAMHLFSSSEVDAGVSYNALNIAWWDEFRGFCRGLRPDCLLVGEVWTESNERALYYRGLDSTFHFYLGNDIADLIQGRLSMPVFVRRLESACLAASLVSGDYVDAPFLSNHDMPRYAETTAFGTDDLKLSAAILLTMEGIPFVYYGEELGIAPYPGDFCPAFRKDDLMSRSRTAFPWEDGMCDRRFPKGYRADPMEKQVRDGNSLLLFYRRMIRLRKECAALRYGRFQAGECTDALLSYDMVWGNESVRLAHNISDAPVCVPKVGKAVDLMTGEAPAENETGDRWILLGKHSMILYI